DLDGVIRSRLFAGIPLRARLVHHALVLVLARRKVPSVQPEWSKQDADEQKNEENEQCYSDDGQHRKDEGHRAPRLALKLGSSRKSRAEPSQPHRTTHN